MNLIDKFENAEMQTVRTFNSIFYWNPILDEDFNSEVKIGSVVEDNKRLIFVNENKYKMDLLTPKVKKPALRVTSKPLKQKRTRIKGADFFKFSKPFLVLDFGEYFIYNALLEMGEVSSLEYFSKSLRVCHKTTYKHIASLIKKGYVEKTTVYKGIIRD